MQLNKYIYICILKLYAMCWFAAYTKPRSEFKALEHFSRCGVNAYVPEYSEKRAWSDRIKKVRVPAVSGYVFFEIRALNYDLVNLNPYVKNVVKNLGFPVEISDAEMIRLKNCLKIYTESLEIKSGDSVKVNAGLFKNKRGVVEKFDSNFVTLLVNSIKLKLSLSEARLSAIG